MNQAALFGDRNENGGRHDLAGGPRPAGERLDAAAPSALQFILGLVVHLQCIVPDCVAETRLQGRRTRKLRSARLAVGASAGFAAKLRGREDGVLNAVGLNGCCERGRIRRLPLGRTINDIVQLHGISRGRSR